MNIYLLELNEYEKEQHDGSDHFDKFVVYAENEEDAINMNPDGGFINWNDPTITWSSKKENIIISHIGTNDNVKNSSVIIYSYNLY